jgi:hypothetical protein
MAIVIFINVVRRDSLAPRCTPFEFLVVNMDTSVNDIDIDTLAAVSVILILGESTKRKPRAVADACETLQIA